MASFFMAAYAIALGTCSENWHFLGSLGPALSAMLITAIAQGKAGLWELEKRSFKYRIGRRWLIAISPVALFTLTVFVDFPISRSFLDFSAFVRRNSLSKIKSLFLWLLPVVSYGIFEEIGWRGFALPQLLAFSPSDKNNIQ